MTQKKPRKKTSIKIDPDLWQQFKLECVRKNVNMSDVLEDLVKTWLPTPGTGS